MYDPQRTHSLPNQCTHISDDPDVKGSGLGLDIFNKIVDKYHSSIRVESRSGQMMFNVALPI